MQKISISLTDAHAELLEHAVASGQYASASEVVRESLRLWRERHIVGALWDEGMASGPADPEESIDEIKKEARRLASL